MILQAVERENWRIETVGLSAEGLDYSLQVTRLLHTERIRITLCQGTHWEQNYRK